MEIDLENINNIKNSGLSNNVTMATPVNQLKQQNVKQMDKSDKVENNKKK